MSIFITEFAKSHFDASKGEAAIPGWTPEDFEKELNTRKIVHSCKGYADFCSMEFYENWTDAKLGIIPINDNISSFIRSDYEARRETELPVLTRYINDKWVTGRSKAKYLCIVLYSTMHLIQESATLGTTFNDIRGNYGVVNILRLNDFEVPPMQPITMMRNALGISEGGSGVPLNREEYMKSVEFWRNHITVIPG